MGKTGGEPRNSFKLSLPVYHGLDGSLGVFGLPEELAPTLLSQTHEATHLGHEKLEELI